MIQTPADPIASLLGGWSSQITLLSVLFRIGCSILLSALVGWERSSKRHSAGLRTFMLVCLAGTVAMLLDIWLYRAMGTGLFLLSVAAVIATVMIATHSLFISSRNQIKGITTSAGLLLCCFLGISLGAGLYTLTAAAAAGLLICLSLLPSLEAYLKDRSNHFEVLLELTSAAALRNFVAILREIGLKIDDIETNPAYLNSGLSVYSVSLSIRTDELKKFKTHKEIIEALSTLEYVNHIEEI